jgi:hypothetical protein
MGVCNASLQAVHCDNGIGAALHNVLYMAIKCEYLFCTWSLVYAIYVEWIIGVKVLIFRCIALFDSEVAHDADLICIFLSAQHLFDRITVSIWFRIHLYLRGTLHLGPNPFGLKPIWQGIWVNKWPQMGPCFANGSRVVFCKWADSWASQCEALWPILGSNLIWTQVFELGPRKTLAHFPCLGPKFWCQICTT